MLCLQSDYEYKPYIDRIWFFPRMVPERRVMKRQNWGLDCVEGCQLVVGIEIVQTFVETVRHTKLAFQSVKRTLFLPLIALY